MKVNILTAKMDREDQYDFFIYYLNEISEGLDICVYVTSCRDKGEYSNEYFKYFQNLKIIHSLIPINVFNKSKLLNRSFDVMRKDYDVVCVFDIDMIYNFRFFKEIAKWLESGFNFIVSYGKKLTQESTDTVIETLPDVREVANLDGSIFKGCSQISFTKQVYDIFIEYFGYFYDEKFEGWGGEDSDISYKSKIMDDKGIIRKLELHNMWTHLRHPDNCPDNYRTKSKNSLYFQSKKEKIYEVINCIPVSHSQ